MNYILALTGVSGSGKDTIARYLSDEHGLVWVSYADALRAMLPYPEDLDPIDRDSWERTTGYKDRMVALAAKVNIGDPYTFIKQAEDKIALALGGGRNVVLSDLRSPLALASLTSGRFNSNVWVARVIRENNPHPPKPLDSMLYCIDAPEIHNRGTKDEFLSTLDLQVSKTLLSEPHFYGW